MSRRLSWLGLPEDHGGRRRCSSCRFATETFDYVYSIGCLHHTGDVPRSIEEVHRVLVPGGRAVVMLYNRHSLRRMAYRARGLVRREQNLDDEMLGLHHAHDSASRRRTPTSSRSPR